MKRLIKQIKNRFFHLLPATLTWLTLILAFVVSFWQPVYALYFIILFSLMWLGRIIYLLISELTSWFRYRQEAKIDWRQKLKEITEKDYRDYHHLIFLPTYKEPYQVIDKTMQAIADSYYDTHKFIIVLAGEERDKENFLAIAEKLQNKFSANFLKILITLHPENLPGDVPGKGSNINYAGHRAKELIDELGFSYEKVIVTAFDIDTRAHPQYFARLTHKYLTTSNPTRASYQPIAMYHNNVWESDPFTRIVSSSTTFWLLTELARSDRLYTFSSHSMSFKALVDVGFWQKDIVTEDSRIFLQGMFHYDGDYRVEPIYIPVYMNTVNTGNLWRAIVDQYKQMRRWAWGIEHYPYMMKEFKKHPKIPFSMRSKYVFNMLEGQWSWATAPIMLTFMGRLPLWVADKSVHSQAFAQMTPLVLEKMMTFAMLGILLNAFLMIIALPEKPKGKGFYHYILMFAEWMLLPVTMIIFGSIPAIESQTRLALGGKYKLGFWVSRKK